MSNSSKLREMQLGFARHIRNPDVEPAPAGVEDRRMGIYRDLFFNNIKGFLSNNFPVLRRLYSEERWLELVRDFFVRHRAHTPLFPELPREFLQFIEEHRGPEHGDPPFMLELAHYEWVELALSLDESDPDDVAHDPRGDLVAGAPVLSPLAWLLSYRFPVHRIRRDFRPAEPPAQPTYLVVYRNDEDRVKFMEVNAVTARLIELIRDRSGASGQALLEQVASESGIPPERLIQHGREVLDDLRSRGILLGTLPPPVA